jgi:hypothetical protein
MSETPPECPKCKQKMIFLNDWVAEDIPDTLSLSSARGSDRGL